MRMFLLGGDVMVRRDSIVGVFDLDTTTVSGHTREYLRRAQEGGAVISIGEDLPQTFVVAADRWGGKASPAVTNYLSPHSSTSLAKKLLTSP